MMFFCHGDDLLMRRVGKAFSSGKGARFARNFLESCRGLESGHFLHGVSCVICSTTLDNY